mgnify:CR=1 FL=1
MAITLDIARDNPNAPTVSGIAASASPEDEKPTLIGLTREEAIEHLGTIAESGTKAFADLIWALLNTPEFIFIK